MPRCRCGQQAAAQAKTTDPKKVAEEIHQGQQWNTVLGPISYDAKGDITVIDYVFYVWKNGKYSRAPGRKLTRTTRQSEKPAPTGRAFFQPILPSTGKVSSSHTLIWLMLPVRNAIPVKTSNAPMACSTR